MDDITDLSLFDKKTSNSIKNYQNLSDETKNDLNTSIKFLSNHNEFLFFKLLPESHQHEEAILDIFLKKHKNLNYVSKKEAITWNERNNLDWNITYLPTYLQDDANIVFKVLLHTPLLSISEIIPIKYLNNKEFMKKVICTDFKKYYVLGDELKEDIDLAMEAAKFDNQLPIIEGTTLSKKVKKILEKEKSSNTQEALEYLKKNSLTIKIKMFLLKHPILDLSWNLIFEFILALIMGYAFKISFEDSGLSLTSGLLAMFTFVFVTNIFSKSIETIHRIKLINQSKSIKLYNDLN